MTQNLLPKATDVLSLIGNTPMVKVANIDTGCCELYLKMESQNPGGSIKDRIALTMIEAAEREGTLKPGGVLVEATAGNTGLGLALVASQKGYKLLLVIPDKMSQEKIFHLKALGAEVVMARSDVQKGHPEYYQEVAARIASETEGAFYVSQFENPHNPRAHEESTGPEILAQMNGDLDAMIVGVGSGGTLTGLGRYFTKHSPKTELIVADPKGSILAPLINDGIEVEAGSWIVEGIGEDFIPIVCELQYTQKAYSITDAESIATARLLLQKEGIICGSSSGTLIASALRYCREQTTPKRVVTFVCDSGNKYLSKIYNEYWLDDHGFVEREAHDSLRDLIIRPYHKGSAVTVSEGDTLQATYRKMKMYDMSQLPVMKREKGTERIVGIINETDILLAITGNPAGFGVKVAHAMTRDLITVDVHTPPQDLMETFKQGMVAIVMDGEDFVGLITPIDVLQYLRKRVGHA
jgi:cystathionine beta-synthase